MTQYAGLLFCDVSKERDPLNFKGLGLLGPFNPECRRPTPLKRYGIPIRGHSFMPEDINPEERFSSVIRCQALSFISEYNVFIN